MEKKTNYPVKRNGYIYSQNTKKGFLKMQKQGIPRPLFSLQDKLAKLLFNKYKKILKALFADLKAKMQEQNITTDSKEEDFESMLESFKAQEEKLQQENETLENKVKLTALQSDLENEWLNTDFASAVLGNLKDRLDSVFKKNQKDYFEKLLDDADTKTASIFQSFSIDKKDFFNKTIDTVRNLYLDNSIDRIKGEEDLLKRKILQKIADYTQGKSETLDLTELVKSMYDSGEHLSRLFARDQMQRFNKACTLATFENAKVKKVKWVTCSDSRVRLTHKRLNGKVFDINNLPREIDDYNCRCGLVPVEWEE